MLKRLIEVAVPLKEVSEHSAREKRQLSALHLWWARRPLPVCRMAVFASLIPDPDDPPCPEHFRRLVMETLKHDQFRPSGDVEGKKVEDTARNRCLEFIKHLVKWENSHKPEFIEPARKLIAAAHTFLHPGADTDAPRVLDSFAGGAAIPLEAMRLGCEAYAVDINPIAHLIELCTLAYPQQYGQPNSRTVPSYIKRLVSESRLKKKAEGDSTLFDTEDDESAHSNVGSFIPDVEISEAEYLKNPLAADVKYWGHWILSSLRTSIGHHYENRISAHPVVCYWWAKTVTCPNPACRAQVPLLKSMWLSKRSQTRAALRMTMEPTTHRCRFDVVDRGPIDFDADAGTIQRGRACCPFCSTIMDGDMLRSECKAGRLGQQLIAVIEKDIKGKRKSYRAATESDFGLYREAEKALEHLKQVEGLQIIPQEPIPSDRPAPNSRGLSAVVRYGFGRFGDLFNPRQLIALTGIVRAVRQAAEELRKFHEDDYATAVVAYLAILVDKHADYNSILQWWHASNEQMAHTFSRQALSMVWDYCEVNPFNGTSGGLDSALNDILSFPALKQPIKGKAVVAQGSATRLGLEEGVISAVVIDPPYYDSVPYSDLSDYFYVWIKRILVHCQSLAPSFRSPVTPKKEELIAYYGTGNRVIQKTPAWYGLPQKFCYTEQLTPAARVSGVSGHGQSRVFYFGCTHSCSPSSAKRNASFADCRCLWG